MGRLNRTTDTKNEITVYDYVDINIRYAINMYEERLKGYKRLKFDFIDKVLKNNVYTHKKLFR